MTPSPITQIAAISLFSKQGSASNFAHANAAAETETPATKTTAGLRVIWVSASTRVYRLAAINSPMSLVQSCQAISIGIGFLLPFLAQPCNTPLNAFSLLCKCWAEIMRLLPVKTRQLIRNPKDAILEINIDRQAQLLVGFHDRRLTLRINNDKRELKGWNVPATNSRPVIKHQCDFPCNLANGHPLVASKPQAIIRPTLHFPPATNAASCAAFGFLRIPVAIKPACICSCPKGRLNANRKSTQNSAP